MRVSHEEKQKSRARILQAASRRIRENGIAGTGLAEVMKDAGMTHGGFYKHFADKDALVRAALAQAFDTVAGPQADGPAPATPEEFREVYLSAAHRDNAGQGCPIAALGAEVARADTALRQVMTDGVEARLALLQRAPSARPAAIRDLAMLIGALILSRTVTGTLADEVLSAVRAGVGAEQAPGQRGPREV
jgi:TetR/AcrR family transcriptional repressor of nem operon